MLQLAQKSLDALLLQHSVWDGTSWLTLENGEFNLEGMDQAYAISASISPAGRLAVVFSATVQADENDQPQNRLFYTERSLELPVVGLQTVPARTPKASASPVPTLTPTPQPTPTLDLANLGSGPAGRGGAILGNEYGGVILGTVLVALAIVAAVAYRTISTRFKNHPS
jgi:hypothetical protein